MFCEMHSKILFSFPGLAQQIVHFRALYYIDDGCPSRTTNLQFKTNYAESFPSMCMCQGAESFH
jgi:hypothetical protein